MVAGKAVDCCSCPHDRRANAASVALGAGSERSGPDQTSTLAAGTSERAGPERTPRLLAAIAARIRRCRRRLLAPHSSSLSVRLIGHHRALAAPSGLTNCSPAARTKSSAEQVLPKPERGLEPLTYRLQGDTSVPPKTPDWPANRLVLWGLSNVGFRLV